MDRSDIEGLHGKASGKMAIKFAMDVLKCKTTEELKEVCYDIIDAINYLTD